MEKNIKKASLVLAVGLALTACKQDRVEPGNESVAAKTEAAKMATKLELTDLNQKAAYSIGLNFSKQMKQNFESLKQYDVEIDTALVVQGIKDGFEGNGQFNDEELNANMQEFQTGLQAKMKAEQEKLQAEAKAIAEKNKADGEAFRVEYAKKEGVKATESGLLYQVLTQGEGGAKPVAADTVKVHYKGTMIDGKQFDSSYDRGNPTSFPLNGVIKGWTEGLQLMSVGDKFEFVLPAEIAYGEHGSGSIPGNSTLIFQVELLDINPKPEQPKTEAAQ